jgi:hypothetical protein
MGSAAFLEEFTYSSVFISSWRKTVTAIAPVGAPASYGHQ